MMHLNNEEQSKYANLGEKENNSSKTKAVKFLPNKKIKNVDLYGMIYTHRNKALNPNHLRSANFWHRTEFLSQGKI